jgi:DNA-binding YbaB/EbfC family protein
LGSRPLRQEALYQKKFRSYSAAIVNRKLLIVNYHFKLGGYFMGFNMQKLMKQAQKMQNEVARVQEELKEKQVEGVAGGGMVRVQANGAQEIISISIDPEVIDPEDKEMLEDLVLAAVREALSAAQELASREMGKVTGGMGLPGGMF